MKHNCCEIKMALLVDYPRTLRTLDLRGPRGPLTKEKAEEMVAAVTSGAQRDYERIILSTWALSEESATVIADAMLKLPQLESVVMADIIAGRPEAEGLAVYHALEQALVNMTLQEIDFSDNAVGTKGVEACRRVLATQARAGLQRMFFCNCGISAEAARSIADIMLAEATPTAFKLLHFHNNMSGSGGAIAIADMVLASPQLEDFRFTASRGRSDGGVALARAFSAAPQLRSINLHDNVFTSAFATDLASSLMSLHHLHNLDVGDTLLGDAGMTALAAGVVLGCADSLTHLDVAANEITKKGAVPLARCVRALKSLQVLRAEENEMGNAGAFALARALMARGKAAVATGSGSGAALQELHLSACEFKDRGVVAIATAVARSCPGLRVLDLSDNDDVSPGAWARAVAILKAAGLQAALKGGDDADEDEEPEEDVDVEEVLALEVPAEVQAEVPPAAVAAAEKAAAAAAASGGAGASPAADDVSNLLAKLEL